VKLVKNWQFCKKSTIYQFSTKSGKGMFNMENAFMPNCEEIFRGNADDAIKLLTQILNVFFFILSQPQIAHLIH
jgi:hypothetical protein